MSETKAHSRDLRVMQIIYSFEFGGSEIVAKNIAKNMTSGVIHGVCCLGPDGPLRSSFHDLGVQTWVIAKSRFERFAPMIRLWKAMRDFKPHVVHTHHLYELFYTWPGALLCGARIIHTEHEYFSLMKTRAKIKLRLLAKLCKAITGVNEETSRFLCEQIGLPRKKVFTILNGIDTHEFSTGGNAPKPLDLKTSSQVVGIVARLHHVKGHMVLLDAFAQVVNRFPRAELLIIGDGECRQELEAKTQSLGLAESIHFLGNRSDIPQLLAAINISVLASFEEGLPMSVLEAMAAGNPVVATAVGGVPKVVVDGKTGILVKPGDSEQMANSIISLLLSTDYAKSLGLNGSKLIRELYDMKAVTDKYLKLYNNVVA